MPSSRILFLNQVAGPLFRELAEDLARELNGAELLTGHTGDFARAMHPSLRVISASNYDRRSLFSRLWSWLCYFGLALVKVFSSADRPLLFIVSNPPFLPAVGLMAALLRGQRFCVLVYDLYPGVLVRMGRISQNGPVSTLWRAFNCLVWGRAESVFTIGDYMAENIRREGRRLKNLRVTVIPNWADVEFIKPLSKSENQFLSSLGWSDERKVVLYSGNLGDTHNLGALLDAADRLRIRTDLGFLIIGTGARWNDLSMEIARRDLSNVKLLPFQPENLLPQTLAAGDISVVAMEKTIAGYMVPSKTYYYLAAGSALLALVPEKCEIADLVVKHKCGIRPTGYSGRSVAAALVELLERPDVLSTMRENAREAALKHYSRKNTALYLSNISVIFRDPVPAIF